MVRVSGGFANRVYRLDTDLGSFAVKELNLVDRRWTYRAEEVFRFEQAAFAAGIPMPEPISADDHILVHRWVEGEKLPMTPVSAAYAFQIGEILAHMHALDVEWTDVSIEEPTPRDWPALAERAVATGQPWAGELLSHVETFLAIADFVDTCPPTSTQRITAPAALSELEAGVATRQPVGAAPSSTAIDLVRPRLLNCLVTPVDGQGRGTIVVSSARSRSAERLRSAVTSSKGSVTSWESSSPNRRRRAI